MNKICLSGSTAVCVLSICQRDGAALRRHETEKACKIWAVTWDFQQCGMCDQERLRSARAYAQSDQNLC